MKFMIRLFALTLALLVSACGSYSPLKQYDKQTFSGLEIGDIRINKQLEIGSWFDGAIAAVQGSNVESLDAGIIEKDSLNTITGQEQARLRAALKQSGLDLQTAIISQFSEALKTHKALQPKLGNPASHRLKLSVDAFLIGYKPLSGYSPDLGLQAEVFNAQGRSAWKNYRYVTHFNSQLPHRSMDDFVNNPVELRKAYEQAISLVIKDLLNDLEAEVDNAATEYVDNITGNRTSIEPIKPIPPAAIAVKPANAPATPITVKQEAKPEAGNTKPTSAEPAKTEAKPAPTKKMVRNVVTGEMEEETNCNGFCGLKDGFKFDNKNLTD